MDDVFCRHSGKVQYANPQAAYANAGRLSKRNTRNKPAKIYKCHDCKMWHITHKHDNDRRL